MFTQCLGKVSRIDPGGFGELGSSWRPESSSGFGEGERWRAPEEAEVWRSRRKTLSSSFSGLPQVSWKGMASVEWGRQGWTAFPGVLCSEKPGRRTTSRSQVAGSRQADARADGWARNRDASAATGLHRNRGCLGHDSSEKMLTRSGSRPSKGLGTLPMAQIWNSPSGRRDWGNLSSTEIRFLPPQWNRIWRQKSVF